MRICELYQPGKTIFSLEVFPPKGDETLPVAELAGLSPAFVSVTVHASGNVDKTSAIAAEIQRHGVPSMAHMTCVNSARSSVSSSLDLIRERGIENILALRGDPVEGAEPSDYRYAEELIRDIPGDFCVGAACYPEGHISGDPERDMEYLKRKQDAGASFFISQLFFDNTVFFRFAEKAKAHGIRIPVSAGVMPVLSRKQIEKMIFLCGASLPARVVRLLHRHQDSPGDLRKAGIELAAEQARELYEARVDGVHIYTMNKPEVAQWIFR
ncbi:MAG: methylenetetrahydrofolate reductase [Oscillospiraceae bacterium]|jgi:methylenetetrahydrofolate reductase (NADPH)|nr:methylenetetrahydrofolate reductase [Oscillospiraceae bacterium]